jgi:hypothetical protein
MKSDLTACLAQLAERRAIAFQRSRIGNPACRDRQNFLLALFGIIQTFNSYMVKSARYHIDREDTIYSFLPQFKQRLSFQTLNLNC